MANEIIEGLRGCELFSMLNQQEVKGLATALAKSCQVGSYEAGDTIFTQGEHKTRLYIVIEGQVLLQRTFYLGTREANTTVAVLGKGRAMGWTALLFCTRDATASAVCQKPTRVISVEGDALRSILEKEPSVGVSPVGRNTNCVPSSKGSLLLQKSP
jgi:CRP/FNR family cyclic AMP-dependent transcriptional regulator